MNAAKIQSAERLARTVYSKCRDCEGEYKNFSNDIRSLQNALQDIEDALLSNPTNATLETELANLLIACESSLTEVSELVDKFNGLPLQSQRTWDRLSWGQEDEGNLRGRLSSLPQQLENFYKRLRESPTAQIDRALHVLAKEVCNGRHETSSANSLSTAAANPDDRVGWEQITRDLGDLGISEELVTEHKEFIVNWILRAINDGVITEKINLDPASAPAVMTPSSEPPRPSSPPSQSATLLSQTSQSVVSPLSPESQSSTLQSQSSTLQSQASVQKPPQSPTSIVSHASIRKPPLSPEAPPIPAKELIVGTTILPAYTQPGTPDFLSVDPHGHTAVSMTAVRPVSVYVHNNQVSTMSMDRPAQQENPDPADCNILKNAERICFHWNGREWKHARENIELQIDCVERGEFVDVAGVPTQPNVRVLKHLLGISYSLAGDFINARDVFESVLSEANLQQLAFDDGDIAAARWLGETCIMSNQLANASLAWAISYYGSLVKHPLHMPGDRSDRQMLDDIRLLNQRTNGLNALKSAFTKTNRDSTTILPTLSSALKFQVVNTVLEAIAQNEQRPYTPRRLLPIISIAEGFLIQPLVGHNKWPLPQDPFFRVESSIDLLFALSRPTAPINVSQIPTTSLGSSKSLTYVTRKPVEWLVDAIRFGLNKHAVEWKVRGAEYLLRFPQTQDRISYYDCFVIQFRKLTFRNLYGFKISKSTYSTRQFTQGGGENQVDENHRKEKLKAELATNLREYIKQGETDHTNGKWPPAELPPVKRVVERRVVARRLAAAAAAAGPTAVEMDSNQVQRSELDDPGSEAAHELMSYEIAELPG